MPKGESEEEGSSSGGMLDLSKLASNVALEGAAAEALAAALGTVTAKEDA